jgi:hypothetical protein
MPREHSVAEDEDIGPLNSTVDNGDPLDILRRVVSLDSDEEMDAIEAEFLGGLVEDVLYVKVAVKCKMKVCELDVRLKKPPDINDPLGKCNKAMDIVIRSGATAKQFGVYSNGDAESEIYGLEMNNWGCLRKKKTFKKKRKKKKRKVSGFCYKNFRWNKEQIHG